METCVSLAKFTRNLVAQNPANQVRALEVEPAIRSLVFRYTTYSATQDPTSYPITRVLTQTLSNIVTSNDYVAQALWTTYLNLPEEQLILTRLFASPDAQTVLVAFVFVLNCIHESRPRIEQLAGSPRGPRTCFGFLDRMASLFEAEESSAEGRAFDLGYEIFTRVIEAGLVPTLYRSLTVEDEPITPHQTTLLKMVDSFLHNSESAYELSSRRHDPDGRYLLDMLTERFLALSRYTQDSIQRALGAYIFFVHESPTHYSADTHSNESAPLQELDLLLPKVCEALVLVTQCLTTITLRAEETATARSLPSRTDDEVAAHLSSNPLIVISAMFLDHGVVDSLVETLRLVDTFVPRITYGKVVRRPTAPNQQESHSTSEAASSDGTRSMSPNPELIRAAQAFAHVKRDLVRLLGIVASQNRAVQDRVRESGGLPVVMNLCVVDDYNPYLREHAIFALRNLLSGNPESQAVVDAIQPVGKWNEDKVLQELRSVR
ncbi:spinocerebellar ataxia type 10 protein domain-containing protein [Dichomitus squalens]|uniref:Ataxin-10 homolog n=1 Tax=Dichomitus squalens TaxID=114155 RepID=A0A4V2K743_9APHY|nr:spinocerebellar ataxia type 10 protein domain-containing protein [Dichomitus squalens]TBU54668.1 spinocerebellar ataxia type 10 protein domain-containing protein [Dichomitus squalens]